jgi:hypothetical protein
LATFQSFDGVNAPNPNSPNGKCPPVSEMSVDDPQISHVHGIYVVISFFFLLFPLFLYCYCFYYCCCCFFFCFNSCLLLLASFIRPLLLSFFFVSPFPFVVWWELWLLVASSISFCHCFSTSSSFLFLFSSDSTTLLLFFSFLLQLLLPQMILLLLLLFFFFFDFILSLSSSLLIFYSSQWVASPFENYIMVFFGSIVDLFLLLDVSCVIPSVLAVTTVGVDDIQRIVPPNISSPKWKDVSVFTSACASLTYLNEYDPTQSGRGG